jgi:hypothetical protein
MGRIAAFLASVAIVLASVAALDWWIDPFLDRYDSAPLAAALAQPQQCFLAWDTFSSRPWPELKLDYFRRRHARVVVVGTSRAGKLEAHPGERRFANLLVPGIGPETLVPLFRALHREGHGRLTVYITVEPFWFGRGWTTQARFTQSYLRDAKYLISAQTLKATLRELLRTPGVIRHPRALRPWAIYRGRRVCVVGRGNSVLAGAVEAWTPDGGLFYNDEVTGAPPVHGVSLVEVQYDAFLGHGLDPGRRAALRDGLELARSYGWRVVGVSLPFSTHWRLQLERTPETHDVITAYRREMPAIFARYGFRFLDLTDVRSVPCGEHSFSHDDGGHPNIACGRKIRRLLDAEAARRPPPRE